MGFEISSAEARYLLATHTLPKDCEVCKKRSVFRGSTLGYQRTCSISCSRKLDSFLSAITTPEVVAKRVASNKETMIRLGVSNVGQLQSTKDKIRKTNLERYGAACAFNSEQARNKAKKTNLERYGAS